MNCHEWIHNVCLAIEKLYAYGRSMGSCFTFAILGSVCIVFREIIRGLV